MAALAAATSAALAAATSAALAEAATSAASAEAILEVSAVAASAASALAALEVSAASAPPGSELSAATSAASVGASAERGLRAAAQDWEPAPSVSAAESVRSRAAGSPDAPLSASAPVCRWPGGLAGDLPPPPPGPRAGDTHGELGSRGLRQSRHRQRRVPLALRVCPLPRPLLRFDLAVVVGRSRRRLDRTGVLALRL